MADTSGKTVNKANVSLGRSKATGLLWWAPSGTKLPTDATTALPDAYRTPGYTSEDGVTNSVDTDTTSVNDMNGTQVLNEITSYSETFQLSLLETNADAMKLRYGTDAVTGTDALKIRHKMPRGESLVLVLELLLTGNRVKRIVIPDAVLTEIGDTQYDSGDAIVYDLTFTANPSPLIDGDTSREYIATASTTSTTAATSSTKTSES